MEHWIRAAAIVVYLAIGAGLAWWLEMIPWRRPYRLTAAAMTVLWPVFVAVAFGMKLRRIL